MLEKMIAWITAAICTLFIIWFIVSWADVIFHQWNGSPSAWNLFEILF